MKKSEMFQEFTKYDRDLKPVDAVRKMDSRSLLDTRVAPNFQSVKDTLSVKNNKSKCKE